MIKLVRRSNTEEAPLPETHQLIDSVLPKAKITASTTSLSWLSLRLQTLALWKDPDLLVLLHLLLIKNKFRTHWIMVYPALSPSLWLIRTSIKISSLCSVSTFPTRKLFQVRWSLAATTLLSSPKKEQKIQIFSGLINPTIMNTGLLTQRMFKSALVMLLPATLNNSLSIMVWVSALFQTSLSLPFRNSWKKSTE